MVNSDFGWSTELEFWPRSDPRNFANELYFSSNLYNKPRRKVAKLASYRSIHKSNSDSASQTLQDTAKKLPTQKIPFVVQT